MPRLALLTPFAFPSLRGNAVTVSRIARGLVARGLDLRVWDLSVRSESDVAAEVEAYRPALIHAFHAYRVGPLAVRLARRAEVPLVVTLTGTDANHDLVDPERALVVRHVLEAATRLTVFHPSIGDHVTRVLPDLASRVVSVPQSVSLERAAPFDLASRWALPPERVLVLFPAGVRMVKNPLLPLDTLAGVAARHPALRLGYAGPILDPDLGDRLLAALREYPWARYLGTVAHAQIASLLSVADVVLNCSISEGGMSNSVLEGLAMGRAVLATDIEGNRSVVEDGVTGLLFRDAGELADRAERLLRDPGLRARLGRAGRALIEGRYPPGREIDGYVAVYGALIPVRCA